VGHGLRAKRSKSGVISFDLLDVGWPMHRSSETIGAIAAALAKAQGELSNPEKAPPSAPPFPREANRTFRWASLASGLVRNSLGQHEIATVQTMAFDQDSGHTPGPCLRGMDLVGLAGLPNSETANPHPMGAALTYARRYALFALI
jgi:hypothetical protein